MKITKWYALAPIVMLLVLTTPAANAVVITYDFQWTGDNGFRVEGTFSYDDAAALPNDPIVTKAELLAFEATAYTAAGVALKKYDLLNQDSFFNFNFNVATGTINQSSDAFDPDGFLIGKLNAPTAEDYVFSTFVGCGSSFPNAPGIALISMLDGSCNGMLLDKDGTELAMSMPAMCMDVDEDGFGLPGDASCPSGAAEDCDDGDSSVNPNAFEVTGNFVDENCDGNLGTCDSCEDWKNHGHYVRCVAKEIEILVDLNLLTPEEGDALVSSSAETDIGKKNFIPPECVAP